MKQIRKLVASLSGITGMDDQLPGLLGEWRTADAAVRLTECALQSRVAADPSSDISEQEWATLRVLRLEEQRKLDAVVARMREMTPGLGLL